MTKEDLEQADRLLGDIGVATDKLASRFVLARALKEVAEMRTELDQLLKWARSIAGWVECADVDVSRLQDRVRQLELPLRAADE